MQGIERVTQADISAGQASDSCGACSTLFSAYPEVMSVDHVAEALGVRPNYVREMLLRHIIRGRKVGYKWRILRSDLREFMLDAQH